MDVTVTPPEFRFVSYDANLIARSAATIADAIGLGDVPIVVEVDETTPLARMTLHLPGSPESDLLGGAIVIRAESGAFEDTRRPRHQSEVATANSLGRLLLRARDRLSGGFGEAPSDADLSLAQVAAWETYCVGRLERLGIVVNQQRWRYNFRNRHGFTDRSDAAFERLWASDGLTWGELDAISTQASGDAPSAA